MNQTLNSGQTLRNGSYRIEAVVGRGNFGITYLATNLFLNRRVAIKEFFSKMLCERDADTNCVTSATSGHKVSVEKLKAKFLKEAINIAKFDHPGIIKIHDAFEENGTAYYVMDYIEGASLSEIVKREGPLSEARALAYIRKVGDALSYIHAKKINHLDVKPANIMVKSSADEPILIDFGLSKQYDSEGNQTTSTPTGMSHGFAPMEQYNDGGVKEFSPQTDLYSLAATLYYMLTGKIPPPAPKLVENDLVFPSSFPSGLIAPVRKAMSPVRKDRYPDVASFVDALTGEADDDQGTDLHLALTPPTPPTPPTTPTRPEQPESEPDDDSSDEPQSNKKKLLFGILIVVAVLAVAGIAIWLTTGRSADPDVIPVDSDSVDLDTCIVAEVVEEVYEDTAPVVEEVAVDEVRSVESDNARGYFRSYASGNSQTYKGAFSDGNRDYPIEIIFRLDGNGNIKSCTYYNNPYNTKMGMSVEFNGSYMILTNGKGDFVINLSPAGGGVWEGVAYSGKTSLSVSIKPSY